MSASLITWWRESQGQHVSMCGNYEVTRKVCRHGMCWWVPYYRGDKIGARYALLANAKSMCEEHESEVTLRIAAGGRA